SQQPHAGGNGREDCNASQISSRHNAPFFKLTEQRSMNSVQDSCTWACSTNLTTSFDSWLAQYRRGLAVVWVSMSTISRDELCRIGLQLLSSHGLPDV